MKIKFKTLFIIVLILISVSTVSAGTIFYTTTTTLSNTINGNSVTNYPITRTENMGRYLNTWIKDVKKVSNLNGSNNASGGIRTFVNVKRKNTLWTYDEEGQIDVYSSTTGTYLYWNTGQGGKRETTVSWQNRTGNTSYQGTFQIEEL